MYTFANVVLMAVINGFGTDTVAAYAAYGKIDALFWMVVGSFGVAVTTFVGQNMGAGRWDRVMQSIRECAVMMFLVLGTVIVVLYVFARPLQQLFCTDPDVVLIGARMMHFLMPFYILYIPVEVMFSALRGMGNSVIPTVITFFGVCVLRSAWGLFIVPAAVRSRDIQVRMNICSPGQKRNMSARKAVAQIRSGMCRHRCFSQAWEPCRRHRSVCAG